MDVTGLYEARQPFLPRLDPHLQQAAQPPFIPADLHAGSLASGSKRARRRAGSVEADEAESVPKKGELLSINTSWLSCRIFVLFARREFEASLLASRVAATHSCHEAGPQTHETDAARVGRRCRVFLGRGRTATAGLEASTHQAALVTQRRQSDP